MWLKAPWIIHRSIFRVWLTKHQGHCPIFPSILQSWKLNLVFWDQNLFWSKMFQRSKCNKKAFFYVFLSSSKHRLIHNLQRNVLGESVWNTIKHKIQQNRVIFFNVPGIPKMFWDCWSLWSGFISSPIIEVTPRSAHYLPYCSGNTKAYFPYYSSNTQT